MNRAACTVEAEFLESSHLGSHFLISASVDKDMQYMYESTCTLNSYIHRTRVLLVLHLVPRSSTTSTSHSLEAYQVPTCTGPRSPILLRLVCGRTPVATLGMWADPGRALSIAQPFETNTVT